MNEYSFLSLKPRLFQSIENLLSQYSSSSSSYNQSLSFVFVFCFFLIINVLKNVTIRSSKSNPKNWIQQCKYYQIFLSGNFILFFHVKKLSFLLNKNIPPITNIYGWDESMQTYRHIYGTDPFVLNLLARYFNFTYQLIDYHRD